MSEGCKPSKSVKESISYVEYGDKHKKVKSGHFSETHISDVMALSLAAFLG